MPHKNCLPLLQKLAALRFGLKQYLMRKMYHGYSRSHCASNDGKLLQAVNYNGHRKVILPVTDVNNRQYMNIYGYWVFTGGEERPGRDADPSPPSSVVVMKV